MGKKKRQWCREKNAEYHLFLTSAAKWCPLLFPVLSVDKSVSESEENWWKQEEKKKETAIMKQIRKKKKKLQI